MQSKIYIIIIKMIVKSIKSFLNIFKRKFLSIKNTNWKANFQAFKNKKRNQVKKIRPYVIIISWYVIILYLFLGFLFKRYDWYTAGFAFSMYFIYEKLRDDHIEVVEMKELIKHKRSGK